MQTFDSTSGEGRHQIVEAYRAAVISSPDRLSFKSFCDSHGITNYKAVLWWCRDHQISLKRIQEHARSASHPVKNSSIVRIRPVTVPGSSSQSSLTNISITFPDGVNLALQECSVENVAGLLAIYSSRRGAAGGM